MTMNNLLITLTNNTPLPIELWLKIVYKHKGFITPSALLIKNHMKQNELMKYEQISLLLKYQAVEYDELNEEHIRYLPDKFITKDLIDREYYFETDLHEGINENKYTDFWHFDIFNLIFINV